MIVLQGVLSGLQFIDTQPRQPMAVHVGVFNEVEQSA